MRVAIITDSNSGITQAEAAELGVSVLPMPMMINGKEYYEDINLTQEQFYNLLTEDAEVSTSQPTAGTVLKLWDSLLETYDEIVHIPMSSGLSSTCDTATMLAQEYNGRVQVVNNRRISVTLRSAVIDALALVRMGKTAADVKKILEADGARSSIYIMVDTMKYLKKGGRVTPAAAMLGTILNIKPVLQIQGGALDTYAKVRGKKAAETTMIEAIKKDFATRFAEKAAKREMRIFVAHTHNDETAQAFAEQIEAAFPEYKVEYVNPLSLSVSCHIGAGALAVGCVEKLISWE